MNGLQVGASNAKNCCVSDLEFIVVVLLCYPDWTGLYGGSIACSVLQRKVTYKPGCANNLACIGW